MDLSNEIPVCPKELRIGGVEGGGTHSTLIILDERGNKLSEVKGPGTNHWSLGMDETIARIVAMINKAKNQLNIPESRPLDCIGLSLSGCEEEESNNQIIAKIKQTFPNAAREYVIGSDTLGSLKTGLEIGGIVLIAGTGSNANLMNSDGKMHNCGGWGHQMGDEGSGYWVSHRACKYVFDDMDGLVEAPHSTSYLWPAMRSFFKVEDRSGMLPHIYSNFDKMKFASFTQEIVKGCEEKDALCLHLFELSGRYMAKHVIALARKANNDLKLEQGGLKVICVGSIWKSWIFLKPGFEGEIHNCSDIDELTMYKLKTSSALGACYLAADKLNCANVRRTYQENREPFYHYKRATFVQ